MPLDVSVHLFAWSFTIIYQLSDSGYSHLEDEELDFQQFTVRLSQFRTISLIVILSAGTGAGGHFRKEK